MLIDLGSTIFSCRLHLLGKATVDSVLIGEFAALLLAARSLSVLHVTGAIGSDYLLVVKHLHSGVLHSPWKLRLIISQFQGLRFREPLQVIKIFKSQNQAAHFPIRMHEFRVLRLLFMYTAFSI